MEKVECYRTKDGQLFASEREAAVHEARLEIRDIVGYSSNWDSDDVENFIIHNSMELEKLLNVINLPDGC